MSQKEQDVKKREGTESEPTGEPEAKAPVASDRVKKLQEEADDILDKIDEVLEKNAASFVKSFIQKGGE